MVFAHRKDAGHKLGEYVRDLKVRADVVPGLPRGGVVVAAAVSQILHVPLDVMAVRKLGHPRYPEYAVGALAEPDVVVLDRLSIEHSGVKPAELEAVIAEETARLREYAARFSRGRSRTLTGLAVLLVDDGLATGATMEAAVLAAKRQQAASVLVAVPVASDSALARIERVADRVFAYHVDPAFDAVGRYYENFAQTTDAEVMELIGQGIIPGSPSE